LDAATVAGFLGGIALFLLGMKTMTQGLRVASGDALRTILTSATRSRFRGILSGIAITGAVQSSSAVIFATIGFVNAALISLPQSVGVIYGASVGTSLTSWIVAAVGFDLDLKALALPILAVGMGLNLTGGDSSRAPFGTAVAGLGLFFLGLDVLSGTFAGVDEGLSLDAFTGTGLLPLLLFTGIGFLLTTLMQSSSAAMAVTITAAAQGVVPLHAAAAFVLGAVLGTCTTAAFAGLAATPGGRRSALSHVALNVATTLVGFAAMPFLLPATQVASGWIADGENVAITLALFHTSVVVLGVLVMIPITDRMVYRLSQLFVVEEVDETRIRYLDRNILETPVMAVDALWLEVRRLGKRTRKMLKWVLDTPDTPVEKLEAKKREVDDLAEAIIRFGGRLGRQGGTTEEVERDTYNALRVTNYFVDAAERALDIHRLEGDAEIVDPELEARTAEYMESARAFLKDADARRSKYDPDLARDRYNELEEDYQEVKRALLRAGVAGGVDPEKLAVVLERFRAIRRATDQLLKAGLYRMKGPEVDPADYKD